MMVNWIKRYPYFYFLISIFTPLYLFTYNLTQLRDLKVPIIILVSIILLSIFLVETLTKVFGNREKVSLIVALFFLIFLSFGHIMHEVHNIEELIRGNDNYFGHLRYQLGLPVGVFCTFILGAILILRTRKIPKILVRCANTTSLILTCIVIIQIIWFYILRPSLSFDDTSPAYSELNQKGQKKPDIYFIILDEYAGSRSLKKFFNFDNSNFIDFLKNKGFDVLSRAHSNYPGTILSMTSIFNMEYLDSILEKLGPDSKDTSYVMTMGRRGKIKNYLKNLGYKWLSLGYDTFHTSSEIALRSKWGSDCEINIGRYEDKLLEMTPLNLKYFRYIKQLIYKKLDIEDKGQHESFLCLLNDISRSAEIPGPKFVYAHILAPHFPFLFDRHGNKLDPGLYSTIKTEEEFQKYYLDYLIFLNGKIRKTINELFANYKSKPIIILQSDHGGFFYESSGLNKNGEITEEYAQLRFDILNAIYLPNCSKKIIYDTLTPVNTFRVIFNYYFNSKFEILPDRMFFSSSPEKPLHLIDVSKKARLIDVN